MATGARVTVRADKAIREIRKLGGRLNNPRPALKRIGRYVTELSQQAFRDSADPATHAKWAKLSPATLALRRGTTAQILVDTARLRQSIHSIITGNRSVTIGSNVKYAAIHQFGGVTSPRSLIPGKRIPARPFLGIDRRGYDQIRRIILRYIGEGRT